MTRTNEKWEDEGRTDAPESVICKQKKSTGKGEEAANSTPEAATAQKAAHFPRGIYFLSSL